jgi:hypothetical protein
MASDSDERVTHPKVPVLEVARPVFDKSTKPGDVQTFTAELTRYVNSMKRKGHTEADIDEIIRNDCFQGYAKAMVAKDLKGVILTLQDAKEYAEKTFTNPGDKDVAGRNFAELRQGSLSCSEYVVQFNEALLTCEAVGYEVSSDEANRRFLDGLNTRWKRAIIDNKLDTPAWSERGTYLSRREAVERTLMPGKNESGEGAQQQSRSGSAGNNQYNNNNNNHKNNKNNNSNNNKKKGKSSGNGGGGSASASAAGAGGQSGAGASTSASSSEGGGNRSSNPTCFYCHGKGHYARECPSKAKNQPKAD